MDMRIDCRKECKKLIKKYRANNEYANQKLINEELRVICDKYAYSDVVFELSNILTAEEAADIFGLFRFKDSIKHEIKTIGVFYNRAYNGGIEVANAQLMSMWHELGYNIVFFSEEDKNEMDYPYPDEVKRIYLGRKCKNRYKKLQQALIENDVDVFINHAWAHWDLAYYCAIIKLMQIPLIVHVHGNFSAMYIGKTDVLLNWYPYAFRSYKIFQKCDLVLTLDSVSDKYFKLMGCKTYQVINPLPDRYKDNQFKGPIVNNHKILWIGRIDEGKRPEDALEVLNLVKKQVPDATLEMVGAYGKKYEKNIKKLAEELDIVDSVYFRGYQLDVDKYYRDSDIVLVTSEKEGFPYVLIETLANGKPCVMYDLPYLTFVKNNKGILSVPIADVNAMAEKVILLFQNHDYKESVINNGRQFFLKYKATDIKNIWLDIFENMLKSEKTCVNNRDEDSIILKLLVNETQEGIDYYRQHNYGYGIQKILYRVFCLTRNIIRQD